MYKLSCTVLIVLVYGCWLFSEAAYTTKYDNIDLDEILNNTRLYKSYIDCLMGEGKCTPDGKELKDVLPDALAHKCAECNEKQKAGSEKVLKFLIENKKDDFVRLEDVYDPDRKYRAMYDEEAKAKGIKIP